MRVAEIKAAIVASVGEWAPLFRPEAFSAIATVVVASAPTLALPDQILLAKLGAWICAIDDFADDPDTDASEVADRVAQYAQLLRDGDCPEMAFDPVARLLGEVIQGLASHPGFDRLAGVLSDQVIASLDAMTWEKTATSIDLDGYLVHATDSVCVAPVATAAAILLGEHVIVDHLRAYLLAEKLAATAVRLANDCATSEREQRETSVNALRLCRHASRQDLRRRATAAVSDLKVQLERLPHGARETSAFLDRFTCMLVETYTHGDLDELHAA